METTLGVATTYNVTWKAKAGSYAMIRHFKSLEEARDYIYQIEPKASSINVTRIDTTHTRIHHIWNSQKLPTL